ncbi:MAG: hypothetical protein KGQ61_09625 [Planctomycetes bacterium]|nr:hypothetical protein [Planctomycetota bacterium]
MSRSRKWLWVVVIAACCVWGVVTAEWLVAFVRRPAKLEVSHQTTWITEPLAADGLPDFFQASLDHGPPAIAADCNAAAAVWSILPVARSNDHVDWSPARLTADDADPAGIQFDSSLRRPDDVDGAEGRRILAEAMHTPWRAVDHPWLASWLDGNAPALAVLATGARREGWCPPRCLPADRSPSQRYGGDPLVMSVTLPVEQGLENIGTAFLTRAMLRLGGGDLAGAWHDLETLLHYGAMAVDAPGPTNSRLVAQTLLVRTSRAVRTLALDGGLEDAALADIQAHIREALDQSPLAPIVDVHERLMILDALTHGFADAAQPGSALAQAGPAARVVSIDVNRLLAAANRDVDALVAVVSQPTRVERFRAWRAFEARMQARKAARPRRAWLQPIHEVVTERVKAEIFGLVIPDLEPLLESEDRAEAALLLADCTVAIERFRLRTGHLPARLDDLVPDLLPAVPVDPSTAGPLGYAIEDGRWTLWSGADPDADDADDLVVRGSSAGGPAPAGP